MYASLKRWQLAEARMMQGSKSCTILKKSILGRGNRKYKGLTLGRSLVWPLKQQQGQWGWSGIGRFNWQEIQMVTQKRAWSTEGLTCHRKEFRFQVWWKTRRVLSRGMMWFPFKKITLSATLWIAQREARIAGRRPIRSCCSSSGKRW